MTEEEKPKKVLDELVFGVTPNNVPFLVLHCHREDCPAQGVVKRWSGEYPKRNIDYAEVSAAVFAHQFQHLGIMMAKVFKGLK